MGAAATAALDTLLVFRSIHPLYGAFLLDHLGIADHNERIQALESVLEVPRPLLRYLRVPRPDTGNQPSETAKTIASSGPSQKFGIDSPINAAVVAVTSTRVPARTAATRSAPSDPVGSSARWR